MKADYKTSYGVKQDDANFITVSYLPNANQLYYYHLRFRPNKSEFDLGVWKIKRKTK